MGGGIRSLNVALRQILDLYVCLRPVRWFTGVPSPVVHPEKVDMVIFRENTEDIYAGLEVAGGHAGGRAAGRLPARRDGLGHPRAAPASASSRSPRSGSKRLIRAAIQYALDHERKSVTLVHKGNIQKFTEGAFRNWGYELVREEFADVAVGWDDCGGNPGDKLLVKDTIADITLQQVLTRPDGLRRHRHHQPQRRLPLRCPGRPGRRHRDRPGGEHQLRHRPRHLRGHPRHRAQVRRAGQGQPGLGAALGRAHVRAPRAGHDAAADIVRALEATIADKIVTYDFARLMEGATEVKCSEFAGGHRRPALTRAVPVPVVPTRRRGAVLGCQKSTPFFEVDGLTVRRRSMTT